MGDCEMVDHFAASLRRRAISRPRSHLEAMIAASRRVERLIHGAIFLLLDTDVLGPTW